ncbi:ketopantoate reductase PanE/ApbA-domain-containing protein [Aspergillus pseudoustus]|uniref:2-dehydropantoate 2-reductase n=1 Tax=Aspergillus pseudoustus TaxID=1810923 RepID=A0ABR4I8L4_9EURO
MRVPLPRIHVLGLGSIGTFTAHGLREIPNALAVTLLLHRESLYDEFLRNNRQISLQTLSGTTVRHGDYSAELCRDGKWRSPPSSSSSSSPSVSTAARAYDGPIDHLIVTVKATQTVSALRSLTTRLKPSSTILFLQNGCGMLDEVNEHLFPDPCTRPHYLVGVISHGVTLTSPFNATHTGAASISLGAVPRENATATSEGVDFHEPGAATAMYMLRALPLSPLLSATAHTYTDLLQTQLEKLAVNAFCNPVCALHDAKNGFLFGQPRLRRAILAEISAVVLNLPELAGVPGLEDRFAVERLEGTVNGILERTRETTCSMVVDLRNGRETEVRYINGYWVRRGREVGLSVAVNEGLMEQVLERSRMGRSGYSS